MQVKAIDGDIALPKPWDNQPYLVNMAYESSVWNGRLKALSTY